MKHLTQERACHLFSALSHPGRLQVAELLSAAAGEAMSVGVIASTLNFSQSATSQHLSYLTRVGVLTVEQRGTSRLYRVRGPRIKRILTLIEEFCEVHELYGAVADEGEEGSTREPSEAEAHPA